MGKALPGPEPSSPGSQPQPPLLAGERDCLDRSGDYTANPGLRPESTDPSLWSQRRGVRMGPEDEFLSHPSLTGSRKHKAVGRRQPGTEDGWTWGDGNGE